MSRAPKGGRRRLDASVPPEYDLPTREPRIDSPRTARTLMLLVFIAWLLGTAGAATSVVAVGTPNWVERPSAALLMIVFAVGLTHRGGGHMRIWFPMTAVLGVLAVVLEANVLLAASAAVTAVLAAVWAVLVTRPAETLVRAIGEYVLALVVALSGTVGVAAWNAPVNYQRFNLIVLTVSLGFAITLVWNLGAGLHGLGRQNLAILLGVAALVVMVLAYSSFVRTHGSQSVVQGLSDLVIWTRQTFQGVPRPVEVFIGFPALLVGVSLRSKRREGWWVLVFAVIGTAVLTTSLVTPGAFPTYIGLSTLYSSIRGLLVGLALRRQFMKERSSRASRAVAPVARVEPPRFAPLK
ncbi:hypothetical protein C6I20_15070 [Aeromicrobium sp. A1-2]|uniref:hypothetical protein n=1 Tax=Aeromicrobium sp. A1-2 TaxID=2107713 RepID=UPI000E519621|nr:hypothetical protein [Aeromicrobium sp. A1-2]AXT86365.1 hypothetical protein C6I20_15070 [Aeromicrobium sp. A1-2]